MLVNKKILITGATGFVGYHLAKSLQTFNTIYCIVRPTSNIEKLKKFNKIQFIYYNGSLPCLVKELRYLSIDITFHLASSCIAEHTMEQVDSIIASNILFPTQLLEALTYNSTSYFVNTGTFWQNYLDEPYNPTSLYAATKESFDDILRYYHEINKLSCVTLRLYDTYGPEDERKKLFWLLSDLKKSEKCLDMSLGEQRLNLVHIDDIVRAYILAAELLFEPSNTTLKNEIYGVYNAEDYSLKDVVTLYEKIHRCQLKINWGKRPYRSREVMKPAYLYPTLPNWKPTIDLSQGLLKLI